MVLFDNLITLLILFTLGIIVYLKVTNKTLVEFYREIREIMYESQEEVIEPIR